MRAARSRAAARALASGGAAAAGPATASSRPQAARVQTLGMDLPSSRGRVLPLPPTPSPKRGGGADPSSSPSLVGKGAGGLGQAPLYPVDRPLALFGRVTVC